MCCQLVLRYFFLYRPYGFILFLPWVYSVSTLGCFDYPMGLFCFYPWVFKLPRGLFVFYPGFIIRVVSLFGTSSSEPNCGDKFITILLGSELTVSEPNCGDKFTTLLFGSGLMVFYRGLP